MREFTDTETRIIKNTKHLRDASEVVERITGLRAVKATGIALDVRAGINRRF